MQQPLHHRSPPAGPRRALVTAAAWGGTYAAAVVGPAGGER
ncbi:hypothetical protein ABT104_26845 [Streptomyces mobaraensis]